MESEGERFQHNMQNNVQLEIYELFTYGIFRLILVDRGWLQANETTEKESADK